MVILGFSLMRGAEGIWDEDTGIVFLYERHCVGNNLVPTGFAPRCFPVLLAVGHTLVAWTPEQFQCKMKFEIVKHALEEVCLCNKELRDYKTEQLKKKGKEMSTKTRSKRHTLLEQSFL